MLCVLAGSLCAHSQNIQERVFVHPNSQVFVSGETLRFSAYTLSHQTGKVSTLSKILYVQLIGEEGPVFEQKVALENGRGSGEFFVNSLVPTGRYQLLGYTRWMRNFDDYFQLPVTIINPFETELPEFHGDSILRISFYHPNNQLIKGIDAQVGFRIHSSAGAPAITTGKILNASGDVVKEFSIEKPGMGYFNFKPEEEAAYQVLLEDELGNISFHAFMPVVAEGYDVQLERNRRSFIFIPRVVNRPDTDMNVEIYFGNSLWMTCKVYAEEINGISHDKLPSEVFQMVLTVSGEPVYTRSIIPATLQPPTNEISGLLPDYGIRDSLNFDLELPAGQYSLSIHKKLKQISEVGVSADQARLWSNLHEPLVDRTIISTLAGEPDLVTAIQRFKAPSFVGDSVLFLPEVRDELVRATLQSTRDQPIARMEVALAFPGKNPQLKTGFTDEEGNVLFHHQSLKQNQEAYFSVQDHQDGWQFIIEEKFMTEFPSFDYSLSTFDSLAAIEIQQRSIDNQLVNAFQDEIIQEFKDKEVLQPQFTQWNFQYALDDYARFPDFKEYFVEYIVGAGIKNGGIQIRKEYYRPEFQNRQLVLLDGVPVSPQRVLELDPYLVENVRVMMNRTYLGASVFDGVVLIETYERDLADYAPISSTKVEYQGIAPASNAFSGLDIESSKPDRRIHLFWNPVLNWDGGTFYLKSITSDVSGDFELSVEGFSEEGKPVSIRKSFQVKR